MKKLKDYKDTATLIEIHNDEEYKEMVPLLNEIFSGWKSNGTYFRKGGYVDMNADLALTYDEVTTKKSHYEILQASEFLETSQPKYKVGDWVLTSNDANGYGSNRESICGKILQITEIDLEDMGEYGGRYFFNNDLRTVEQEIVRKALPNEIPIGFEDGKWYKVHTYEDTYFKFKSIENRGSYNTIQCYDVIWKGKYVSGDRISNTEAEQSATLLIDLTEIQQYLPTSHLDKILNTFEVGKWYCNGGNTFAKCERVGNRDSFHFSEWIKDGEYKEYIGSWVAHDNMREAPLTEIQQYLPNNSIVGRWVKYLIKYGSHKEGEYAQIVRTGDGQYVYCKSKEDVFDELMFGTQYELMPIDFRPTNSHFQAGDYVVMISHKSGYSSRNYLPNHCFLVSSVDNTYDFNTALDCSGSIRNGWSSEYFEWRFATDGEIKEYKRIGKPFDVNTISLNPYVEIVQQKYHPVTFEPVNSDPTKISIHKPVKRKVNVNLVVKPIHTNIVVKLSPKPRVYAKPITIRTFSITV